MFNKIKHGLIAYLILVLMAVMAANLNLFLPSLIHIQQDLHSSDFSIQLSLIIGPALAIISNIKMGLLDNRYSRKTLLIFCIASFIFGSMLCGFSHNIILFLLGRGWQVLGDAGISVVGFAILADLLPKTKLGEYLGYNTILSTIFCICAPPMGSCILIHFGWRMNFFILSIVCIMLLILFYFFLEQSDYRDNSLLPNKISLSNLLKKYYQLLKSPIFVLAVLTPAFYATSTSLFDFYGPALYMNIHKLSPEIFSYVKTSLISISVIAAISYIYVLKKHTIPTAFHIGLLSHFIYAFGLIVILLRGDYNNTYFFFILASTLSISGSFVGPISMLKAISCFPQNETTVLSIFAIARNIISTLVTFIAACSFHQTMQPIIIIVAIISLLQCCFLFLMKQYIEIQES